MSHPIRADEFSDPDAPLGLMDDDIGGYPIEDDSDSFDDDDMDNLNNTYTVHNATAPFDVMTVSSTEPSLPVAVPTVNTMSLEEANGDIDWSVYDDGLGDVDSHSEDGEEEQDVKQAALLSASQVIKRRTNAAGVVSMYKSTSEIKDRLVNTASLRHIHGLREKLGNAGDNLTTVQQQLTLARQKAQDMEKDLQAVTDELNFLIDHTEDSFEKRTNLTVLRKRQEAAQTRLQTQQQVVEQIKRAFFAADRKRDLLKAELSQYKELEKKLHQQEEREGHEETVLAQYTTETRERHKQRRMARQSKAKRRENAIKDKKAKEYQDNMNSFKQSASRTRKRLEDSLVYAREQEALMGDFEYSEHERRTKALLSLKDNTAKAMDKLKAENENREKKIRLRAMRRERERKELEASGRNAQGVFMARDERARMKARAARLKKEVRQKEKRILDQLIIEDEQYRKKVEATEKKHAEKIEYRNKLGRSIIEQTISAQVRADKLVQGKKPVEPPLSLPGYGSLAPSKPQETKEAKEEKPALNLSSIPSRSSSSSSSSSSSPSKKAELETEVAALGSGFAGDLSSDDEENAAITAALSQTKHVTGGDEYVQERPPIPIALNETRAKLLAEKNRAALAKANKRRAEGKRLIVCGREYSTSKFLSDPAKIIFKDFTVGSRMKQRITLTNVSFTFNTFKILDLPDEFVDFFTVKYRKKGRMSAGQVGFVDITFKPKIEQDIETVLPCMAETGPFSIPLLCYTKKAVISVKTPEIDLGNVILGEQNTGYIVIHNDGALDVPFTVKFAPSHPGIGEVDGLKFEETNADGGIKGYSKIRFPLTFAPMTQHGYMETRLKLHFGPKHQEILWGSKRTFTVLVKAVAHKVPVYVAEPVLDFQTTCIDKLYRCVCRLHNRAPNALKAQLAIPKSLQGYVSALPSMGYVQSRSYLDIQLKFIPRDDFLARLSRFHGKKGVEVDVKTGHFSVPIQINVPDQVLPVIFTLKSRVVQPKLLFSHKTLRFGKCPINTQAALTLTITNQSPLLQKIAFVKLPKSLSVQPENGFISILPFRTRTVNVIFKPSSATEHKLRLVCQTKLGDQYTIPCYGAGVEPIVEFSHPIIKMGATANGDLQYAETFLTNLTNQSQSVHLILPDQENTNSSFLSEQLKELYSKLLNHTTEHFLTISPKVAHLDPFQTIRVDIKFAPRIQRDQTFPEEDEKEDEEKTEDETLVETSSRRLSSRLGARGKYTRGKSKDKGGDDQKDEKKRKRGKKLSAEEQAALEAEEAQAKKEAELKALLEQQQKEEEMLARIAGAENDYREAFHQAEREQPLNSLGDAIVTEYSDLHSLEPDEPWSRHSRVRIPVFIALTQDALAMNEPEAIIHSHSEEGTTSDLAATVARVKAQHEVTLQDKKLPAYSVSYFEVHTTVKEPCLEVNPPILDFKQVAKDQVIALTIEIRNKSGTDVKLDMEPLGLYSPFTVLNELRPMKPDGVAMVVVEFRPKKEKLFEQNLVLHSEQMSLTIPLTGHCVSPTIVIEPGYKIDMGNVLAGDTAVQTFTISNTSSFPFPYSIQPVDRIDYPEMDNFEKNLDGKTEFYFVPGRTTVLGHETCTVECHFSPDHASKHYGVIIQLGEKVLHFTGRCHDRQAYLLGGETPQLPSKGGVSNLGLGDYQNPVAFLENDLVGPLFNSLGEAHYEEMDVKTKDKKKKSSKDKKKKEENHAEDSKFPFAINAYTNPDLQFALPMENRMPERRHIQLTFDTSQHAEYIAKKEAEEKARLAAEQKAERKKQASQHGTARGKRSRPNSRRSPGSKRSKREVKKHSKKGSRGSKGSSSAGEQDSINVNLLTRTVTIGSCLLNGSGRSGDSSFDISFLDAKAKSKGLFEVTPATGKVSAGSEIEVEFSLDLNRYRELRDRTEAGQVLKVGQWVEATMLCTLKGGFSFDGSQEETIEISLRCYVDED